jgi:ferritin
MELFNPISEQIKSIILARLANEYEAHLFYRNASNWCENTGFTKAAAYFAKEAADELTHAEKLQKFLNDWGVFFTVPNVTVTPVFIGLYDCINKAYGIEVPLYQNYNQNAGEVFDLDKSTFELFQEMVQIQYSSVAEYRTMIDNMALYGNDKLAVKMFEDETFG